MLLLLYYILVLGDVVDDVANVVASIIELDCAVVIPINVATACINVIIVDAAAMFMCFIYVGADKRVWPILPPYDSFERYARHALNSSIIEAFEYLNKLEDDVPKLPKKVKKAVKKVWSKTTPPKATKHKFYMNPKLTKFDCGVIESDAIRVKVISCRILYVSLILLDSFVVNFFPLGSPAPPLTIYNIPSLHTHTHPYTRMHKPHSPSLILRRERTVNWKESERENYKLKRSAKARNLGREVRAELLDGWLLKSLCSRRDGDGNYVIYIVAIVC